MRDGTLTPRELEVVALLAMGLKPRAAAAELGISPRTLELHVANGKKALGCVTLFQLGFKVGHLLSLEKIGDK